MVRGTRVVVAATLALFGSATAFAQEPAPREFYGIVSQGKLAADDFDRMATGQVGTLRMTLPWPEIDRGPLPNDNDWDEFDRLIAAAAERRIEVLPTIFGVPHWVSVIERCDGPEHGPCGVTPPRSAVGLNAWQSFVAAAVRRYGAGGSFWALHPELPRQPIEAWQIWNEQNVPGFYQPRPSVGDYARLLDAAAEGIRGEDPDAKILLGGMFRGQLGGTSGAIPAPDFLAGLYHRPGAAADFDGVAIHPYASRLSGVKKAVNRIVGIVRAAGDTQAGIWITEVGWASGGRPSPLNRGPRGQAARLEQAFSWLTARRETFGLQAVLWYAWRDLPPDETGCEWCAHSGLFEVDDMVAKPAWERFLQFTGGS